MNKAEVAKLLTIASMVDNRTVGTETVEAWHMALERTDFEWAKRAIAKHWQESTEYLLPAHIITNVKRLKAETERDIRVARARGIITDAWPEGQPLGATEREALASYRSADSDEGAWRPTPSGEWVPRQLT